MECALSIHRKECRKNLGCALSTGKYGTSFGEILKHLLFFKISESHRIADEKLSTLQAIKRSNTA
jgi:hypothetical protein